MDELSLFFSNGSCAKSASSPERADGEGPKVTSRKKTRSLCANKIKKFDEYGVLSRSSNPEFSNNDTFGLSPQEVRPSYSFNDCSDLPLTLPPEVEEGNIEYKLKLVNPSQNRFEHLVTQMKWRLNEGGGQAIYRLGVDDNGAVSGLTVAEMSASLSTIYRMARRLGASLSLLRECTLDPPSSQSPTNHVDALFFHRKAVELLVQRHLLVNQGLPDLCIAMLGSVDVGKSTLLGILTDGELDNGRGRARLNLFRHLHEVQTGRTSSLSSEVIGFDAAGHLINRKRSKGHLTRRTVDEVVRDSNRLITLLDLAGHPKYQRTTLSGLARSQPTFAALVVSTTCGLTPEGLDHARTAAALGLPLAVVITKIDLLTEGSALETPNATGQTGPLSLLSLLSNSASAPDLQARTPLYPVAHTTVCKLLRPSVTNAVTAIKQSIMAKLKAIRSYSLLPNGELLGVECFKAGLPVFALSNVSGVGLNDLLAFLARVSAADLTKTDLEGLLLSPSGVHHAHPSRSAAARNEDAEVDSTALVAVEFSVTKVYWHVPGVKSPVLAGLLTTGEIHENQKLWLGPSETGQFFPVLPVEIRRNRQPHNTLYCGQMGSLALATEPTDEKNVGTEGAFLPDSLGIRRGMVLLNRQPIYPEIPPAGLFEETTTTTSAAAAAVSWSFSVSGIVWVPCATACSKTSRCLPAVNSTAAVYSGSVCQHAKVVDMTIDSTSWSKLISVSDMETSLLRLNPNNSVVLRFLRQPEYLVHGRQVILSFDSGAKAVGFIDALSDIVTLFSEPVASVTETSVDRMSPSIPNGESLWQTVETEADLQRPATSLDDLMTRVGLLKRLSDDEKASDAAPTSDSTVSAEMIKASLSEATTGRPEKLRRMKKRRCKAQALTDRVGDVPTTDVVSLPLPPSFTLDISPTSTISSTCGVTDLTVKLDECRCFATSPPDEPNVTGDPLTAPEESTLMPQSPSSASPSPPPDPPLVLLRKTRRRVRRRRRRRRQQKV